MRKLKLTAMLLASVAMTLLLGCSGGNRGQKTDSGDIPVSVQMNNSFTLSFDKTAKVKSEKLSIRFINVPEDSRCPEGVHCIWAGQARIDLEISKGDEEPETVQLISEDGKPELAEKTFDNYLIKLLKVEPPRTTERELELKDYKITLAVSSGQQ